LKPVLITLTGPTCGGKTTVLNELTANWNVTPIISTTTRPMRAGEVEDKDYYFISEDVSEEIEAENGFAELVTYNGVRYGVTKGEMARCMRSDLMAIILEPNGVHQYEHLGLEYGFNVYKVFVDVPLELRVQRLHDRMLRDLEAPIMLYGANYDQVKRIIDGHGKRLQAALTQEPTWREMNEWDEVADGRIDPAMNAARITMHALRRAG
jgi:guanylate kinase